MKNFNSYLSDLLMISILFFVATLLNSILLFAIDSIILMFLFIKIYIDVRKMLF